MARDKEWTNEEILDEIAQLRDDKNVKLGKKYENLLYKNIQTMRTLQRLERKGKELRAQGYTLENIKEKMSETA